MEVRINGKTALVKSGSSVQYIAENRAFSKSDSYTMTIEFPLKNCRQNIEIFGYLNRHDVAHGLVRYDAELCCGPTFAKYGVLTITSASEESVKAQFLEGRSVQNYDTTFDDIYLNELTLFNPQIPAEDVPTTDIRTYWQTVDKTDSVVIPWVNDASGLLQNRYDFSTHKIISAYATKMPYLIRLVSQIFKKVGYTCDLSEWEATPYKHLICCNSLPSVWESTNYAESLPHWSLTNFIEQLEGLLACEFDIDHSAKTVTYHDAKTFNAAIPEIALEQVTDDFDVTVSEKDESGFFDTTSFKYADRDDNEWQYLCCQTTMDSLRINSQMTFEKWTNFYSRFLAGPTSQTYDLVNYTPGLTDGRRGGRFLHFNLVYRVKDVGSYFGMRCIGTTESDQRTTEGKKVRISRNKPQILNIYGPSWPDAPAGAEETEIDIVPAYLNLTDNGYALFVPCPSDSTATDTEDTSSNPDAVPAGGRWIYTRDRYKTWTAPSFASDDYDADWRQSAISTKCTTDSGNDSSAYFDRIFVAFWDGNDYHGNWDKNLWACPVVDKFTFRDESDGAWENPIYLENLSLRLTDRPHKYATKTVDGRTVSAVNTNAKYTFSFLADSILNPRAVFNIRGQKFVCAKITATLEDDKLDRLMKGEFYRIEL